MNLNEPFAWLLFSFYLAIFAISIVVFMLQIGVGYALFDGTGRCNICFRREDRGVVNCGFDYKYLRLNLLDRSQSPRIMCCREEWRRNRSWISGNDKN